MKILETLAVALGAATPPARERKPSWCATCGGKHPRGGCVLVRTLTGTFARPELADILDARTAGVRDHA